MGAGGGGGELALQCSVPLLLDITAHISLFIFKYQQQKHLYQSSVLKSSSVKRKFQKEIITGRAKRGKYTLYTLYCCKSKAVFMALACFPWSEKNTTGLKKMQKKPYPTKTKTKIKKTKKQYQQEQKAANRWLVNKMCSTCF